MKLTAPCQCHSRPRRMLGRSGHALSGDGLGFDFSSIDWGGIVGNAVKAYGVVAQTRSAITLQRAQQEAAIRAQEAEFQLMQRRQAQMVSQPASGFVTMPMPGQVMQVMPTGSVAPVTYTTQPRTSSALPSWAIPAAVGVGVLLLMRS